jgi:hypothetical protein
MHMLQPWTFGCRLRTRLWPYHFGIGRIPTWYARQNRRNPQGTSPTPGAPIGLSTHAGPCLPMVATVKDTAQGWSLWTSTVTEEVMPHTRSSRSCLSLDDDWHSPSLTCAHLLSSLPPSHCCLCLFTRLAGQAAAGARGRPGDICCWHGGVLSVCRLAGDRCPCASLPPHSPYGGSV